MASFRMTVFHFIYTFVYCPKFAVLDEKIRSKCVHANSLDKPRTF